MESAVTASAPGPPVHTKQYVFVDEYNRHKRLKVMRACDGCRKRKIRCDGALQNGPWPCGACVRLKLKCVPPTLDPDDEQQASATFTAQGQYTFQNSVVGNSASNGRQTDTSPMQPRRVQEWAASVSTSTMNSASTVQPHGVDGSIYSSQYFSNQLGPRLDPGYPDDEYLGSVKASATQFRPAPSLLRTQTEASGSSGGDPQEVDATIRELSGQMGDLSIETTSVAPYIANEKKTLAETPAVEEAEIILPPSVGTDSTVRVPPEMMPSDERAMDYFGYFFNYIHPYVPVLNRQAFYDQWRSARHSISPLLLEGVFACVAVYLDEPLEVRRWLALGARHEESFKDVPRLSTIQAMILLTKAREFIPRRGYYYRSWMAVKYMTTMAFDLLLHEHHDQHRFGSSCKFSKADCMVRTRIWQTLFNLEILVGAPQGRTDFAIELETLEVDEPVATSDVDTFEYQTSRRFTFLAQTFRNIKVTNSLWQGMRRYKKDWALDTAFVRHNEDLVVWLRQLPSDIQIHYPEDGSPPWLGNDHFLAYVHIYHHLVVIMHHRPQLQALLERRDSSFRTHLDVCLQSASQMCRLQEALIRDFREHGLQFFQRGINFTIYCVLTCTMLHLAAITSPDATFNSHARMYFTRHMRVLEHCLPSASPEMLVQINALREAFSNDTSKAFELKPTLGLRSPALEKQTTPPEVRHAPASAPIQHAGSWSHLQDATSSKTMSPASEYGQSFDRAQGHSLTGQVVGYPTGSYHTPTLTSYSSHSSHQVTSAPQMGYALEPVSSNEQQTTPVWDPSGIFQQWNSAFGAQGHASPQNVQPPDPRMATTPTSHMPQNPSPTSYPVIYSAQSQLPSNAAPVVPETLPAMPTVTPVMWQDAFTTAYVSGHGNKRYRQEDPAVYDQYAKRRG